MNKLMYIKAIIIPLMRLAADMLENIDEGSTGSDDIAAKALRAAVAAINEL